MTTREPFSPPRQSYLHDVSKELIPMKMYVARTSPNSWKVRSAARELNLSVDTSWLNLFVGDQKVPTFLTRNPNGRVPVLEDDGLVLWESNAILAYLAALRPAPSLLPIKPRERAEVDRWLFWESTTFSSAVWKVGHERIIKPIMGLAPDAAAIAAGTAEFATVARVLDHALDQRDYLAGKLSIADFAMWPFLSIATGPCGLDIAPYQNLSVWRDRVGARASVTDTLAEAQAAVSA